MEREKKREAARSYTTWTWNKMGGCVEEERHRRHTGKLVSNRYHLPLRPPFAGREKRGRKCFCFAFVSVCVCFFLSLNLARGSV